MASTTHALNIIIKVFDEATAPVKKVNKEMLTLDNLMQKSIERGNKQRMIIEKAMGGMADTLSSAIIPAMNEFVKQPSTISDAISASQQKLGGWINPIDQVTAGFKKTTKGVITFDEVLDKTVNKLDKDIVNANNKAKASFKALENVLLSVGLAFLFTGMMVKAFFENLLKSIWATWRAIIDVHDEFFQKTQQLTAAWEFFKFSLMDALGQSTLFLALIDAAISLINWFGQLSPAAKEAMMILLIGGLLASTAMMLIGAALLFLLGPLALLKVIGGASFGTLATGLIIVFAATAALIALWTSESISNFDKKLGTIGVAATALGALMFRMGLFSASAWMFIIAAVVLAIAWIHHYRWEIFFGILKAVAILKFFATIFFESIKVAIAAAIVVWDSFWASLKLGALKGELLFRQWGNSLIGIIEGVVNKGIGLFNMLLDGIRNISITFSLPAIPYTDFKGLTMTIQPFAGLGTIPEVSIGRLDTGEVESQIAAQEEVISQLNEFDFLAELGTVMDDAMSTLQDELMEIQDAYEAKIAELTAEREEENKALWEGIAASVVEQTNLLSDQMALALENNTALNQLNESMTKNTEAVQEGTKSEEDIAAEQNDLLDRIAVATEEKNTYGTSSGGGV